MRGTISERVKLVVVNILKIGVRITQTKLNIMHNNIALKIMHIREFIRDNIDGILKGKLSITTHLMGHVNGLTVIGIILMPFLLTTLRIMGQTILESLVF